MTQFSVRRNVRTTLGGIQVVPAQIMKYKPLGSKEKDLLAYVFLGPSLPLCPLWSQAPLSMASDIQNQNSSTLILIRQSNGQTVSQSLSKCFMTELDGSATRRAAVDGYASVCCDLEL